MKNFIFSKNILVSLMVFAFGVCFNINAEASNVIPVRVSNLGAERFIKQCNYYISQERVEQITMEGILNSDNRYDYWGGGIVGGGVTILLSVNKEGYVHSVDILSENKSESLTLAGSVLAACLGTIGLTNDEVARLFNQKTSYLNVWCSETKRNILVYTEDYKNRKCTHIVGFI